MARSWITVNPTLTPDNRILLIHTTAVDASGKTQTTDDSLVRVGAGSGLAGSWRSTRSGINVTQPMALTPMDHGGIHWVFPSDEQFYDVVPDGSAAVLRGGHSTPGVTLTLRAVTPTETSWTESVQGKPYTLGIDTLIEGGKLKEETWQAAHPSEKQEAVYERTSQN